MRVRVRVRFRVRVRVRVRVGVRGRVRARVRVRVRVRDRVGLGLGHCAVLDAGSAREDGVSRAVWQGLEFVRYLLSSRWLGRPTQPAAAPQFARHARELSDVARRKVWLASPRSNSKPSP